jgi:hypothetical protein
MTLLVKGRAHALSLETTVPLFDMPDHETHRAYIRAVATTLERAGIPVTDVSFPEDADDEFSRRQARLSLGMQATMPLYGEHQTVILWDEEDGWGIGWGPAADHVEEWIRFGGPILAQPQDVATTVRAALTELPTDTAPDELRDHEKHDEAFELVLDAYTIAE